MCEQLPLYDHLQRSGVPWRQRRFPRLQGRPISQHESVIIASPLDRFSSLEVSIWGLHHYAVEIEGAADQDVAAGIHLNRFLGDVLVFLEHARHTIGWSGLTGPLLVEISLRGVRGVPWIHFSHGFADTGPSSVLDDDILLVVQSSTEELTVDRDAIARRAFRSIFMAMNWAEAARDDAVLRRLSEFGYEYNLWGKPPAEASG